MLARAIGIHGHGFDLAILVDGEPQRFPIDGRERYAISVVVVGQTHLIGRHFGTPVGDSVQSMDDDEIVGVFGDFLMHAIESSDEDSRAGWDVCIGEIEDYFDLAEHCQIIGYEREVAITNEGTGE